MFYSYFIYGKSKYINPDDFILFGFNVTEMLITINFDKLLVLTAGNAMFCFKSPLKIYITVYLYSKKR